MTAAGLIKAITRRLSHASEDDLDVDTAAREHHARLMGHDLSIEERRERARRLGSRATSDDRAGCRHRIAG